MRRGTFSTNQLTVLDGLAGDHQSGSAASLLGKIVRQWLKMPGSPEISVGNCYVIKDLLRVKFNADEAPGRAC